MRRNNGVHTIRWWDERPKPTKPGVWVVSYYFSLLIFFQTRSTLSESGEISDSLLVLLKIHFSIIFLNFFFFITVPENLIYYNIKLNLVNNSMRIIRHNFHVNLVTSFVSLFFFFFFFFFEEGFVHWKRNNRVTNCKVFLDSSTWYIPFSRVLKFSSPC